MFDSWDLPGKSWSFGKTQDVRLQKLRAVVGPHFWYVRQSAHLDSGLPLRSCRNPGCTLDAKPELWEVEKLKGLCFFFLSLASVVGVSLNWPKIGQAFMATSLQVCMYLRTLSVNRAHTHGQEASNQADGHAGRWRQLKLSDTKVKGTSRRLPHSLHRAFQASRGPCIIPLFRSCSASGRTKFKNLPKTGRNLGGAPVSLWKRMYTSSRSTSAFAGWKDWRNKDSSINRKILCDLSVWTPQSFKRANSKKEQNTENHKLKKAEMLCPSTAACSSGGELPGCS